MTDVEISVSPFQVDVAQDIQSIAVTQECGELVTIELPSAPVFGVTVTGTQGPAGPTGADGEPGLTHIQSSASAVWTIAHSIPYRPQVSTTDSAGEEIIGDVQHTTPTLVTITFSAAVSGQARLD